MSICEYTVSNKGGLPCHCHVIVGAMPPCLIFCGDNCPHCTPLPPRPQFHRLCEVMCQSIVYFSDLTFSVTIDSVYACCNLNGENIHILSKSPPRGWGFSTSCVSNPHLAPTNPILKWGGDNIDRCISAELIKSSSLDGGCGGAVAPLPLC